MSKYLTVSEVAKILRKSTKTIYRWLDEGVMFEKVVKVHDGYLIPEDQIEKILEKGTIIFEIV